MYVYSLYTDIIFDFIAIHRQNMFFVFNISVVQKCGNFYIAYFLCPRHSKNGGGALSVTPVRACVRLSVIKIWFFIKT